MKPSEEIALIIERTRKRQQEILQQTPSCQFLYEFGSLENNAIVGYLDNQRHNQDLVGQQRKQIIKLKQNGEIRPKSSFI